LPGLLLTVPYSSYRRKAQPQTLNKLLRRPLCRPDGEPLRLQNVSLGLPTLSTLKLVIFEPQRNLCIFRKPEAHEAPDTNQEMAYGNPAFSPTPPPVKKLMSQNTVFTYLCILVFECYVFMYLKCPQKTWTSA
jgi:hypothetical protein